MVSEDHEQVVLAARWHSRRGSEELFFVRRATRLETDLSGAVNYIWN